MDVSHGFFFLSFVVQRKEWNCEMWTMFGWFSSSFGWKLNQEYIHNTVVFLLAKKVVFFLILIIWRVVSSYCLAYLPVFRTTKKTFMLFYSTVIYKISVIQYSVYKWIRTGIDNCGFKKYMVIYMDIVLLYRLTANYVERILQIDLSHYCYCSTII